MAIIIPIMFPMCFLCFSYVFCMVVWVIEFEQGLCLSTDPPVFPTELGLVENEGFAYAKRTLLTAFNGASIGRWGQAWTMKYDWISRLGQ